MNLLCYDAICELIKKLDINTLINLRNTSHLYKRIINDRILIDKFFEQIDKKFINQIQRNQIQRYNDEYSTEIKYEILFKFSRFFEHINKFEDELLYINDHYNINIVDIASYFGNEYIINKYKKLYNDNYHAFTLATINGQVKTLLLLKNILKNLKIRGNIFNIASFYGQNEVLLLFKNNFPEIEHTNGSYNEATTNNHINTLLTLKNEFQNIHITYDVILNVNKLNTLNFILNTFPQLRDYPKAWTKDLHD